MMLSPLNVILIFGRTCWVGERLLSSALSTGRLAGISPGPVSSLMVVTNTPLMYSPSAHPCPQALQTALFIPQRHLVSSSVRLSTEGSESGSRVSVDPEQPTCVQMMSKIDDSRSDPINDRLQRSSPEASDMRAKISSLFIGALGRGSHVAPAPPPPVAMCELVLRRRSAYL